MSPRDPAHPAVEPPQQPKGRADLADTRLLRVAACAAVLVHVAFVFVPLPSRDLDLPRDERPAPIEVSRTRLDPPVPERPQTVVRPGRRRTPLPMREIEPERLDPAPEPVLVEFDEAALPMDSEPLLLGAEQPPPVPAVVPEGTPGLVAPVRRPGAEQPVYPAIAVQAKLEGRVVLSAVIGEDGRVREIVVLSAPRPDVGFADAAIEAVRSWEYEPGRMRGRAVAVQLTVVVQFRLR